jgi:hypothetical protein
MFADRALAGSSGPGIQREDRELPCFLRATRRRTRPVNLPWLFQRNFNSKFSSVAFTPVAQSSGWLAFAVGSHFLAGFAQRKTSRPATGHSL